MTPDILDVTALSPAMELLPDEMDTPQACVMVTAICLQESNLQHRRQVAYYRDGLAVHGPARGWAQFERIGVQGVMEHRASRVLARKVAKDLGYPFEARVLHHAMEHHDVLCLAYARLNLWTHPQPLPEPDDVQGAKDQYIRVWRPGAWTRGTPQQRTALTTRWARNYARARA